jgi:hypothetical protein
MISFEIFITIIGQAMLKHCLSLNIDWIGRAVIRIVVKVKCELLCKKIGLLKEVSIPCLNVMEWEISVSRDTAYIAPHV